MKNLLIVALIATLGLAACEPGPANRGYGAPPSEECEWDDGEWDCDDDFDADSDKRKKRTGLWFGGKNTKPKTGLFNKGSSSKSYGGSRSSGSSRSGRR